jgi:hypothetical protein
MPSTPNAPPASTDPPHHAVTPQEVGRALADYDAIRAELAAEAEHLSIDDEGAEGEGPVCAGGEG